MAAQQRKYTAQFKAKVVLAVLRGEKSSADACRAVQNSQLSVDTMEARTSRWRSLHELRIGHIKRLKVESRTVKRKDALLSWNEWSDR